MGTTLMGTPDDGQRTRPKHVVETVNGACEKCCIYSDNSWNSVIFMLPSVTLHNVVFHNLVYSVNAKWTSRSLKHQTWDIRLVWPVWTRPKHLWLPLTTHLWTELRHIGRYTGGRGGGDLLIWVLRHSWLASLNCVSELMVSPASLHTRLAGP
jgi:hypothetical protein